MNNYDRMLLAAQRRFLEYDPHLLAARAGVEDRGDHLATRFFAQQVCVFKEDGHITLDGEAAGFGQTLSILDWLCDGQADAVAAEIYCPVGSLPGVYVGGSGLNIEMPRLAAAIDAAPDNFCRVCQTIGATEENLGDLGVRLEILPGLHMCLKFYFADDEFPPQLTLLWDRNMMRFVRYETIYYIAGCLYKRLLGLMGN
jgi:hypothetical protein